MPDALDDATAAAARMAMVAITSVQVAEMALNDWVIVFGLGLVGNLAAQLFQLSGARVIGVDTVRSRRELAGRIGINHIVGGDPESVANTIQELTQRQGVRVAVDAVGDSRVVRQASQVVAPHGQVVLLGTPQAEVQANLTDLVASIHLNWITFTGALEWRIPLLPEPHSPTSTYNNLVTIFDLIQRRRLAVSELISHRMPPDEVTTAYESLLNLKNEYWGVVLDWTDG